MESTAGPSLVSSFASLQKSTTEYRAFNSPPRWPPSLQDTRSSSIEESTLATSHILYDVLWGQLPPSLQPPQAQRRIGISSLNTQFLNTGRILTPLKISLSLRHYLPKLANRGPLILCDTFTHPLHPPSACAPLVSLASKDLLVSRALDLFLARFSSQSTLRAASRQPSRVLVGKGWKRSFQTACFGEPVLRLSIFLSSPARAHQKVVLSK